MITVVGCASGGPNHKDRWSVRAREVVAERLANTQSSVTPADMPLQTSSLRTTVEKPSYTLAADVGTQADPETEQVSIDVEGESVSSTFWL